MSLNAKTGMNGFFLTVSDFKEGTSLTKIILQSFAPCLVHDEISRDMHGTTLNFLLRCALLQQSII